MLSTLKVRPSIVCLLSVSDIDQWRPSPPPSGRQQSGCLPTSPGKILSPDPSLPSSTTFSFPSPSPSSSSCSGCCSNRECSDPWDRGWEYLGGPGKDERRHVSTQADPWWAAARPRGSLELWQVEHHQPQQVRPHWHDLEHYELFGKREILNSKSVIIPKFYFCKWSENNLLGRQGSLSAR